MERAYLLNLNSCYALLTPVDFFFMNLVVMPDRELVHNAAHVTMVIKSCGAHSDPIVSDANKPCPIGELNTRPGARSLLRKKDTLSA